MRWSRVMQAGRHDDTRCRGHRAERARESTICVVILESKWARVDQLWRCKARKNTAVVREGGMYAHAVEAGGDAGVRADWDVYSRTQFLRRTAVFVAGAILFVGGIASIPCAQRG